MRGGGFGADRGITRLFDTQNGGQIAWLLPAALLLLVAGLVVTWRAPRTDRTRASLILWGGWLLVTSLVFSFMEGIYHQYYTVALAPAVAAAVAVGAAALWQRRDHIAALATLAAVTAVTAAWAWQLLGRTSDWFPWLRWVVLATGIVAAAALLGSRFLRRVLVPAAVAAVAAVLVAPSAYALNTAATEHRGSIPTAGPAVPGGRSGGGFRGGSRGGPGGLPGGPGTAPTDVPSGAPASANPGGRPGNPSGRPGGNPSSLPGAGGAGFPVAGRDVPAAAGAARAAASTRARPTRHW